MVDKHSDKEEKGGHAEGPKAPVYTGAGFIPLEDLMGTVTAWQQRKVLCEEVDLIEQKGGIDWLLRGLKTDLKRVSIQIDSSTIEARKIAYGTNELPQKALPTFFELLFEALQDLKR